ncbi:MAG: [FeFe] hydrogenase H-cluster maturation GTPase HydF [Anaerovoracaceae bacterium]
MSLNDTPKANRLHIGIFGEMNSGKSTLLNALTGQDIAVVSDKAGTTTDPVYKAMELHPIGPVVFIDTAGFDDTGKLGELRVQRTEEVIKKTDVAILIDDKDKRGQINPPRIYSSEMNSAEWEGKLVAANIPIIKIPYRTIPNVDELKKEIAENFPEEFAREKILRGLVSKGDTVLLVMPQDIQAPKGRLILPQVQTIRELLDNKCTTVCTTADSLDEALKALIDLPDLIITDSQCFPILKEKFPKQIQNIFNENLEVKNQKTKITSFSILMAAYKGDIEILKEGAKIIKKLTPNSKILIAEACTHAPLEEDIGRVKIPLLIANKVIVKENNILNSAKDYNANSMSTEEKNDQVQNFIQSNIDICAGSDYPKDLRKYDLIIHCGACMFNRKYMMSRINQAKGQGVPITNYGLAVLVLTK